MKWCTVPSCVWLLWLRVMFPVLSHHLPFHEWTMFSFIHMCHILFVHFSVDGHEQILLWSCCESCCCEHRWCCVGVWLLSLYSEIKEIYIEKARIKLSVVRDDMFVFIKPKESFKKELLKLTKGFWVEGYSLYGNPWSSIHATFNLLWFLDHSGDYSGGFIDLESPCLILIRALQERNHILWFCGTPQKDFTVVLFLVTSFLRHHTHNMQFTV